MLRLARICTMALGFAAIAIAIIWPDIIGLLLFTYHVWAPAVILPICVGVLTKKRSSVLTRNIFITMVASTTLTLSYRGILFLQSSHRWVPFSESLFATLEGFDPSVFGVLASCIIFLGLTVFSTSQPKLEPGS